MYVETIPNRGARPTVLIREAWREGKKIRRRTIGNITSLPERQIEHAPDVVLELGGRRTLDRDMAGIVWTGGDLVHHQAVGRLGEGLEVSARYSEDGVIEGLEHPGRSFVVGVQWHPETFWEHPDSFQPLFDALARAGTNGDALAR